MTSTEDVVRRYFAVVADLGSTPEQLDELLHPDAVFVEFPNAIAPEGHERDVAATMRGFAAGKQRLSAQRIDVHEILGRGRPRGGALDVARHHRGHRGHRAHGRMGHRARRPHPAPRDVRLLRAAPARAMRSPPGRPVNWGDARRHDRLHEGSRHRQRLRRDRRPGWRCSISATIRSRRSATGASASAPTASSASCALRGFRRAPPPSPRNPPPSGSWTTATPTGRRPRCAETASACSRGTCWTPASRRSRRARRFRSARARACAT